MKRHIFAIALTLPFAVHAMEQDCAAIEQVAAKECAVCLMPKPEVREVSSSELLGITCCSALLCEVCSSELKSYNLSQCPAHARFEQKEDVTVNGSLLRKLFETTIEQKQQQVEMRDRQSQLQQELEGRLLKQATEFRERQEREAEERVHLERQARECIQQEAADNNHYAVLGISQNATAQEIRIAYRRLCHESNLGTAARKKVNEANMILSDPMLRADYNLGLQNNPKMIALIPQTLTLKKEIELPAASEFAAGPPNRILTNQLYHAILVDAGEEVEQIVLQIMQGEHKKHFNLNEFKFSSVNQTPFALAISLARPKAVKALLKCGARVDYPRKQDGSYIPNVQGVPTVHAIDYSLEIGDIESAAILLRHGKHLPNVANIGYIFQNYDLAPESCLEILDEIFSRGCVSEQGYIKGSGDNIWVFALQNNGHSYLQRPLLDLFIKKGLNPNQDIGPRHPLGMAIQVGCPRSVALLLDAGADVSQGIMLEATQRCPAKRGTLIEYATQLKMNPPVAKSYEKIIQLLQEHGGRR